MNVTYQDQTKQRSEEYALLQQASECLKEVIGQTITEVSARWEQGQDERGRKTYTLTLSNAAQQMSATLATDELRSLRHLRSRLLDLWGDFLQALSDAQMKKLLQMIDERD